MLRSGTEMINEIIRIYYGYVMRTPVAGINDITLEGNGIGIGCKKSFGAFDEIIPVTSL